jgi:DNA-binding XRE family transcriptional regulator
LTCTVGTDKFGDVRNGQGPEERSTNPVRARRLERGLTQEQLATAVGCDQRTISGIERGVDPSLKLAQAIASKLDATLDELFGEAVAS